MLRVDEDVLLDLGLLAVEKRPVIDRWQVAPTPAHEADDSEREEYARMEWEQRDAFEREYYGGMDAAEWSRG